MGRLFQDELLTLEGPQRGDKHERWGSSSFGGFQTSGRQSHSHPDRVLATALLGIRLVWSPPGAPSHQILGGFGDPRGCLQSWTFPARRCRCSAGRMRIMSQASVSPQAQSCQLDFSHGQPQSRQRNGVSFQRDGVPFQRDGVPWDRVDV